MKAAFELPPPILQRLRAHVPNGKRSRFAADVFARKLQHSTTALEKAAQKASRLRQVNQDMKAWEALNRYEC